MHDHSANDRFKRRFNDWFWGSMVVAALLHGLMFTLWPAMGVADAGFDSEELTAIELPPVVDIPPAPQAITRPALPVVTNTVVDEEITIAPTTPDANPVNTLPPPPTRSASSQDIESAPVFTPFEVAPRVLNRDEVQRVLERSYPSMLRDAGIGGRVDVWFFLDEAGQVLKYQVNETSGYPTLDSAALKVADIMRFSPAKNRDRSVRVWVSLPITFSVGK